MPITMRNFTTDVINIRKGTRIATYCRVVEKLSSLPMDGEDEVKRDKKGELSNLLEQASLTLET